ncbi:hypothetical protein BJX66DRAFT_337204 [Aspergillus keveii]|uniref:Rhodopsin domain-containing protein n=1 Tax=Aspergillus keveii TaxID=714993 RepID=A0ABR4G858_9EURO
MSLAQVSRFLRIIFVVCITVVKLSVLLFSRRIFPFISNMLIDILILAGPIRVVQNLQMPMAKKVSVISIFLLGFVRLCNLRGACLPCLESANKHGAFSHRISSCDVGLGHVRIRNGDSLCVLANIRSSAQPPSLSSAVENAVSFSTVLVPADAAASIIK